MWPFKRHQPSPEAEQARQRLEEAKKDDQKVDALSKVTQRMLRENNLGPAISRALGARR